MKEKNIKFKRLLPIFIVLLVIVLIVVALFIKYGIEKKGEKPKEEKTATDRAELLESFKPKYPSGSSENNDDVFPTTISMDDSKFNFKYTPYLDFMLEEKKEFTAFIECEILDVSTYVYCNPYFDIDYAFLSVYIKNDLYGVLESNRKVWLPIALPFEFGVEGFDEKFASFCAYLYSIDHALIYVENTIFHDSYKFPVRDENGNEIDTDLAENTNIVGDYWADYPIELEKFDIIPLREQDDGELVVDLKPYLEVIAELGFEYSPLKDFPITDGMPAKEIVYRAGRALAEMEYFAKWYIKFMSSGWGN